MGLDFIRRTAPSYEKKWDRGLASLYQPQLFSREGRTLPRTVLARLENAADVTGGKEYVVRAEGSRLVLIDGLRRAGVVDSPPQDVLRKIEAIGGCTLGTIVATYHLSRSVEIEL